jgi:hypothetical protein
MASYHSPAWRKGFRRAAACECLPGARQSRLGDGRDNRIGACPPLDLFLTDPVAFSDELQNFGKAFWCFGANGTILTRWAPNDALGIP